MTLPCIPLTLSLLSTLLVEIISCKCKTDHNIDVEAGTRYDTTQQEEILVSTDNSGGYFKNITATTINSDTIIYR